MRYALRMLRKSPGLHRRRRAHAGSRHRRANTALFSVCERRAPQLPLPYHRNSEQVVTLADWFPGYGEGSASYLDFLDWVRASTTRHFPRSPRIGDDTFNLTGQGDAEQVTAMDVSASFFPLLSADPVTSGAIFLLLEDQLGGSVCRHTQSGGAPENEIRILARRSWQAKARCVSTARITPSWESLRKIFYFCCSSTGFPLERCLRHHRRIEADLPRGITWNTILDPRWSEEYEPAGNALAQARADMDSVARSLGAAYPDTAFKDTGIKPLRLSSKSWCAMFDRSCSCC